MQELLRVVEERQRDDRVHCRPRDGEAVADPEAAEAARLVGFAERVEVAGVVLRRRLPLRLDEVQREDDRPAGHAGDRRGGDRVPPLALVGVRGEPLLHALVAAEVAAPADAAAEHLRREPAVHAAGAEGPDGLEHAAAVDLDAGLRAVRRAQHERAQQAGEVAGEEGELEAAEVVVLAQLALEALVEREDERDHAAVDEEAHLDAAVEPERPERGERLARGHVLRLPEDLHRVEREGDDGGRGRRDPRAREVGLPGLEPQRGFGVLRGHHGGIADEGGNGRENIWVEEVERRGNVERGKGFITQ